MLGAYLGATLLNQGWDLWAAALVVALGVGALGAVIERVLLRRLAGNEQGQVLVTLGIAFIIADLCLSVFGGDPMPLAAPMDLRRPLRLAGYAFPAYRLAVLGGGDRGDRAAGAADGFHPAGRHDPRRGG